MPADGTAAAGDLMDCSVYSEVPKPGKKVDTFQAYVEDGYPSVTN